jgi:hypothetical protein
LRNQGVKRKKQVLSLVQAGGQPDVLLAIRAQRDIVSEPVSKLPRIKGKLI